MEIYAAHTVEMLLENGFGIQVTGYYKMESLKLLCFVYLDKFCTIQMYHWIPLLWAPPEIVKKLEDIDLQGVTSYILYLALLQVVKFYCTYLELDLSYY